MEPPEDVTPPAREGTQDEQAATSWAPVDPRPAFGPPEPQASWPAEHTYPVQHTEQPPPVPGSGPEAPGYLLSEQGAPANPGYRLPGQGPAHGPGAPAQQPHPGPPYGPVPGAPQGRPYAVGPYAAPPGPPQNQPYATGSYPAPPGQPYAAGPYAPSGPPQGQPYATGAHAVPQGAPYGGGAYGTPGPGYFVPGVHVQAGPRLVSPEPGTPFHRMDRTRLHSWWRPLVGTLVLGAGLLISSVVVMVFWMLGHFVLTGEGPRFGEGDGSELFGSTTEDLAAQLVMIAVWLPLVPFVVWAIARRPAGTVVSVLGRMRWKWLGACAVVAVGYVVISYGLLVFVTLAFGDEDSAKGAGFPGWSAVVVPLVVIVLLVPFQATAEEFVFRGWLLQAIGGCTLARPDGTYRNGFTGALGKAFATPWPAIVLSSAFFVAGHGYTGWAMLDIGLWAIACGWLAVKTGGLEATIALHVLNNLVAFAAPVFAGELDDALVQGGMPAYVLLADIPSLVFFVGAVLWLRRRMGIAEVTPGKQLPPPVWAPTSPQPSL
ncbi:hypothetical protein GCM10022221_05740 [Actinocorallia aurea]